MRNHFLIRKGPQDSGPLPWKNRHRVVYILFFFVLLLTSFLLRFFILPLPVGALYLGSYYQEAEQFIQGKPELKWLYSLINPNSQVKVHRKEQKIREILSILEKNGTGFDRATLVNLAEVIYEEATRNHHDPKFILSIISIESSFQNWSVSERGAKGLMQIMPYVAESLAMELGIEWSGEQILFNPFLNIKMGIHYFTKLLNDFKDIHLALTAYNYGPTYVKGLKEKGRKIPRSYYLKFMGTYNNMLLSTDRVIDPPTNNRGYPEDIPT